MMFLILHSRRPRINLHPYRLVNTRNTYTYTQRHTQTSFFLDILSFPVKSKQGSPSVFMLHPLDSRRPFISSHPPNLISISPSILSFPSASPFLSLRCLFTRRSAVHKLTPFFPCLGERSSKRKRSIVR